MNGNKLLLSVCLGPMAWQQKKRRFPGLLDVQFGLNNTNYKTKKCWENAFKEIGNALSSQI